MVKMRLFRMGDKKNPIYRVVVVDSRKAATGEYIECVGHYRPTCDPIELTIDVEAAKALFQSVYEQAKKDGNYTDGQAIVIRCCSILYFFCSISCSKRIITIWSLCYSCYKCTFC